MKTLHLIRHAKSSWADAALADHERVLKRRGREDVRLMAGAIRDAGWQARAVYCSSAVRAQQTLAILLSALDLDDSSTVTDSALYTFDAGDLINWLALRSEPELTIVGHNPALLDLSGWLCGTSLARFPTAAYCQLQIPRAPWRELRRGCADMRLLITPRSLK